MSQTAQAAIAVIGIDIGKNSFHIVGQDDRGAIVRRQKLSRGQLEARLANMPPCLIGMEACVGAHHLSRKLNSWAQCPADAGEVCSPLPITHQSRNFGKFTPRINCGHPIMSRQVYQLNTPAARLPHNRCL